MHKKQIIPAIGTIVILATLLFYTFGSALGYFVNPLFDNGLIKIHKVTVPQPKTPKIIEPISNFAGSEISAQAVTDVSNSHLQSLANLSADVSIYFYDPVAKKALYDYNSSQALAPASSLKIVSASAALQELGPDFRFHTATFLAGNDLYLFSNGDNLLGYGDSEENVIGHAGLRTLAYKTAISLREKNINAVNLKISDTYFGTEQVLQSWVNEKVESAVGKIVPMSINRGLTQDQQEFVQDPITQVKDTFAALLINQGIQVASTESGIEKPTKAKFIAKVSSDKLINIINATLKDSDNTLSEITTRSASIQAGYEPNFAQTAKFVTKTVKKMGVDVNNTSIVDSSGLSAQNKVSTKFLVDCLSATLSKHEKTFSIIDSLPIGGVDGSLEKRFSDIPYTVRAKTGTLPTVSSLTGVVYTQSGRPLLFSVICNGFAPQNILQVRQETDALIAHIHTL